MESKLGLTVEQSEAAPLERPVVHLPAQLQGQQRVGLARRVSQCLLAAVTLGSALLNGRLEFGADRVPNPLHCRRRQRQPAQVGLELSLQCGFGQARIGAGLAARATATAVVDEPLPRAFDVLLGDELPAALPAGEETGVGEDVPDEVRPRRAAEDLLGLLELVGRDHRLVRAAVAFTALETNQPHVVGIAEELEDGLEAERLAAEAGSLARSQAMRFGPPRDLDRVHPALQEQVPHLPDDRVAILVRHHDGGRAAAVLEVADWRPVVRPASLKAGAVAAPDVLAQVVDELGGDSEFKVPEEAVVAVGGVLAVGRDDARELPISECLEDLTVVEVIPGQPIHLPAEDAGDLALAHPLHEGTEDGAARGFGRAGFGQDLVHLQATA